MQPPLINGRCCHINCSRMGHFGLVVQHLGVACGRGFSWRVATDASLWNVLISSSTRPPPFSFSLLVSPLLPAFIANFTSPQGVLAHGHLRKQDTFCDFSSLFFSLLTILCRNVQFNSFIILWTNSNKGLGEGNWVGVQGENRIRVPTGFFCFNLTFKDHGIETCWRHAGCFAHSNGLDFSQDDKQLEGPNDWMCLAVIGHPVQSDRWATVGVGGTSSDWGFRKLSALWGSCYLGAALKHSSYSIDLKNWLNEFAATLLHSDNEINPSAVKPLLLVPLPLSCSQ